MESASQTIPAPSVQPKGTQESGRADNAAGNPMPLTLRVGGDRYEGRVDEGATLHASYYLLVPSSSSGVLRAVPVDSWYNFKPAISQGGRSGQAPVDLDEVERRMEKRAQPGARAHAELSKRIEEGREARTAQARKPPKTPTTTTTTTTTTLPTSSAKTPSQTQTPPAASNGGDDEDALDRLEGKTKEDEKLRSALRRAKDAKQRSARSGSGRASSPADEEDLFGEDWEHEQSYDDDDERVEVDQADLEQTTEGGAMRDRPRNNEVEEEIKAKSLQEKGVEAAGGEGELDAKVLDMAEKKKEMRKALSKFGLHEDAEGSESGEEDAAADEDDYEKMAEEELQGVDLSHLGGGGAKEEASQPSASVRKKKRALTPEKASGAGPSAAKKVRTEERPKPALGVPKEEEIEVYLRTRGKMLSSELIAHFKKRLTSKAEKTAFLKTVKKVAKLEAEGTKRFVVLKNES